MTITKVKTSSGLIKWEVRYHIGGRKSLRVRRRFDTRSEAEAHLNDRRSDVRESKKLDSGEFENTTFKAESDYWLQHRSHSFSPGHLKKVNGILKELAEYNGASPKYFQPGTLTQLQTGFLAKGQKPATVNRKLEVIMAILNFSSTNRRIPYNPASGFRKLKYEKNEMLFWERLDAEKFLAFANKKYPFGSTNRWIYVAYLLALNAALRAGEIWGLQPQDIKKDGKLLLIQRQLDRITGEFRVTKGKTSRLVPCNEELKTEIFALVEKYQIQSNECLFRNEFGRPICHENFVKRAFHTDTQKAGVPRIRFHDLRHTGTTLMIAHGLDLNTVRQICGHKNIQTTMNYVHLLGDSLVRTAETFSIRPTSTTPVRIEKPTLPAPKITSPEHAILRLVKS